MRRLAAVVLVVLSCLLPSVATAAGPPAQEQTERERRVARALAIVDDALASVSSLRLPQNRVRLRLSVCDTLWTYDRERAKRVANDAVNDLIALAADTDDAGWREGRSPRMVATTLRQQLIYDLMQRDPELALDALQRTRGVTQAGARGGYDADRELEIQIASMLTSSNAGRALDVAEKSLARGLSYNLSSVLQQARTTDPEGAARLAGEIFDKLKSAKPLTDDAAAGIAVYLISDALQTDENRAGAKPLLSAGDARALEDQFFGALLTFHAGDVRADELNRAVNLGNNLSGVFDLLATRSPGSADALRKKVEEIQKAYARLYGGDQQAQAQPPEDASPEQLVEAAASVPEEMHDNYIYAAAEKARAAGDVDRARSIVASGVQDPSTRRQYADNLDRMAFYDAVSNGRIDAARALLATFDQPAERIQALLQIANAVGLPQHTPQSLALLAEADALAGDRASDSGVFGARLTIAQAYSDVDSARSFAILDSSVDQLDSLLDAAASMEGFGCDRQYQDGELVLFDGGGGRLTALLSQVTQTLTAIAHKDVDRAAQSAGVFRRPESRSLALLAVAKVMFEVPAPADPPADAPATEAPQ